jgi:DinB superfamily
MSPTEALIRELERTRDETLRYFSLGELDLARSYGAGKWSVRFLLHHLTDSEVVFTERLRRVISEPEMVVWYYDQDKWSQALDYSTRPLDASRPVYETLRHAIIGDARRHYERDGGTEFVHSKTGVRTLKDEFDKVAAHNDHHLGQIRQALGRA